MNAGLLGGWEHGGEGRRQRESTHKPRNQVFLFPVQPRYPVGVVLILPGEGSVLGRLEIGVQVLDNSQARGGGNTSKVGPQSAHTPISKESRMQY